MPFCLRTALHNTAFWGHLDITKYLVEHAGSDANAIDMEGKTPYDIAVQRKEYGVANYLKNVMHANKTHVL